MPFLFIYESCLSQSKIRVETIVEFRSSHSHQILGSRSDFQMQYNLQEQE